MERLRLLPSPPLGLQIALHQTGMSLPSITNSAKPVQEDQGVASERGSLSSERLHIAYDIQQRNLIYNFVRTPRADLTRKLLSRCKVLALGRDAFERLMGPCEEVLEREVEAYTQLNKALHLEKSPVSIISPEIEAAASDGAGLSKKIVKQGSQDVVTKSAATREAVKKSNHHAHKPRRIS